MKMKKVLYITTVSRTINAFLTPHIEMLLDNGYEVDCACSIDKEIDSELLKKGVKLHNIPFSRNPLGINNIKAFKKLLEIQKVNNYDIVHVHTPIASIYGRLLKLKFKKLKTIYTAHGYHFFKNGPKLGWILYYPIEKIMAKLTDVTININKEDYEITLEKLKPKKCYLLKGVGINLNLYKTLNDSQKKSKKEELKIKEDEFVIIMIAELNKNKNQIQLIKAIEVLKYECPNIKVLFVGEGDKLEFLKKAAENINEKVIFLGFRNDINELINISDIGVLLSYREGLPRNIMELMANGKKVIATNIRGSKDLISNDSIGKLIEVNDFENTAKAIKYYYNRHDNAEFAMENSNDEAIIKNSIKDYAIENINKEMLKIYIKITD